MFISSFSSIKSLMPVFLSFLSSFAFLTCAGKICSGDKIKVHDIFILPRRMLVFIDLLLEEDKEENVTILPGRSPKTHCVLSLAAPEERQCTRPSLRKLWAQGECFLSVCFSNSRFERL